VSLETVDSFAARLILGLRRTLARRVVEHVIENGLPSEIPG